ncbi:type IV secretory system conjugative DNA transfer family protein [Pseudomonas sp. hsmgli-8]|uniref:Type IV secretory system conjugative DNA transfer family protein n=1 Tax=Pseudomonas quercus TaxID=2722792 RepID=A0ABX0YJI8_9PSED|nr:type IV secretory system conjugative DNA transfer family protein [Pseudomonas quercus]NJP03492.1 type IV secretory system conjugative DNA transfer family protein [Pseudomonas quercus]
MAKAQPISPTNPQQRIEEHPAFLLGKHPTKDVFLASYGQQFVQLAAPPGSMKGVSAVIPNLLSYPDSMVVNDPKFENWDITSGFRASAGHKVFRFSPERLETHRWNPVSAISRDPLYRLGEIRTLARVLFVSDNPKNQEWYNKAGNVFTAILLYLMETPAMPGTLPQTYEIASLGTGIGAWAQQIIEQRGGSGPDALSTETLRELNGVFEASKNKSSGWSTTADIVRDVLSVYAEKTVAWAVSGDDIDFSIMREQKTTIYFSVTEGALKKYGPLMNLFFTQAIRLNSKVLPEQGGHCADGTLRYKYQLALLMDEFAIMGRMEIMETAPALTRGAGLRFFLIFQGKDQIRAIYGEEAANGIMKAIHNEIVFAPGDIKLAEEYSKRLGNTTVRVQNQSFKRRDIANSGPTDSYSEQSRPLMLPQEVNELPFDKQLIFVQGNRQTEAMKILARKIIYFEEDVFNARKNMTPPPLPVGDATKIDALTVPVRAVEAKVALSDAQQLQAEQKQRWSPKDNAAQAGPAQPNTVEPGDVEPDPEPTPPIVTAPRETL